MNKLLTILISSCLFAAAPALAADDAMMMKREPISRPAMANEPMKKDEMAKPDEKDRMKKHAKKQQDTKMDKADMMKDETHR